MSWGFCFIFFNNVFYLKSESYNNAAVLFNSLLPGHQSALSLPCAVGRQLFYCWWVPAAHLPVVPHLRALYPLSLHPCTCLLRPPGGLPCPLPSGGQRTWQVRNRASKQEAPLFLTLDIKVQNSVMIAVVLYYENVPNFPACLWLVFTIYHNWSSPLCSAEGSHVSGQSNGRDPQALAKAVQIHHDTLRTMYFAWATPSLPNHCHPSTTMHTWFASQGVLICASPTPPHA